MTTRRSQQPPSRRLYQDQTVNSIGASTATGTRRMKLTNGGGRVSQTINAIHQNFDFMSQVVKESETRAKE